MSSPMIMARDRTAYYLLLLALFLLGPFGALDLPARIIPRDKQADLALADALFTNGTILRLQLEIPATNVARLRKIPHSYVSGALREGDTLYQDVAIHLKGSIGSFRNVDDKAGFTLNFSAYESASNFHGLKKFHLNNCVQDPTYLSDWFCNELFRKAGVPAPRCAHALVELNGRKLGLYVLMESINEDFLAQYFKNTRGNVYGQAEHGDITDALERMEGKGPLDRADLKALAAACQQPDPAKQWQALQEKLDLNRFLSFMALEVMLCDWDGYTAARHNYRIYQDLDTGRMVFMPHDKDQMIGDPNVPFMPSPAGLVCQAVLKTPEGRSLYRDKVDSIFTNVFQVTVLTSRIDWLVVKLRPTLEAYDANFARDFVNNANGLKFRALARAQSLQRQLNIPRPKPIQFTNNFAMPRSWEGKQNQGNASLQKVSLDNKPALHIKCQGTNCVASWRATVHLPPGRYRFLGRAKTAGVSAYTNPLGSGGGLRVARERRQNNLAGDSDWTQLAHEFTVPNDADVILLCELRANKGEIWFQTDSLRLERLK